MLGAKMNLSKSTDEDVLKVIVLKLQKRVETGATTLLIKVKMYQWPVSSTKHEGTKVLRTSLWTNTVCNYIRQKAWEIEDFKALEIGALKWYKEHIPRDGNDLTEEGQILLDDPELWMNRLTFRDYGNVIHRENGNIPRRTDILAT